MPSHSLVFKQNKWQTHNKGALAAPHDMTCHLRACVYSWAQARAAPPPPRRFQPQPRAGFVGRCPDSDVRACRDAPGPVTAKKRLTKRPLHRAAARAPHVPPRAVFRQTLVRPLSRREKTRSPPRRWSSKGGARAPSAGQSQPRTHLQRPPRDCRGLSAHPVSPAPRLAAARPDPASSRLGPQLWGGALGRSGGSDRESRSCSLHRGPRVAGASSPQ